MSHTPIPHLNTIAHGDCITLLRQLPDACVDLVLTDCATATGKDAGSRTTTMEDGSSRPF